MRLAGLVLPNLCTSLSLTLGTLLCVAAGGACKGGAETPKAAEKPAVAPAEASNELAEVSPPMELDPGPAHIDLSGPQPPQVSAVFFTVDGALIPVACYDQSTAKLRGGPACGKLVPEGSEVYLKSETGAVLDTTGPAKSALCDEDARKPTSISAVGVDDGAQHDWGVWPRAAANLVKTIPVETTTPKGSRLSDEERAAVSRALKAFKGSIDGDLRPKQRAEVDIDGNAKPELFISVSVAQSDDPDRFQFSGLLMARDGDLAKLEVVEDSKRGTQETLQLRGVLDLDGDGQFELWVNLAFDGGAGDRLISLENGRPRALSGWSCGV